MRGPARGWTRLSESDARTEERLVTAEVWDTGLRFVRWTRTVGIPLTTVLAG
jgi:hypothetical protein